MKTLLILLTSVATTAFADNFYVRHQGNLDFISGTDGSSYVVQHFGNGSISTWYGTDSQGGYHSGFINHSGNHFGHFDYGN